MNQVTYQNVIEIIKKSFRRFTPQQQRVAHYILANYHQAAFLKATQLGKAARVSQPTAVRFCQQLGFSGYAQFIETLQKLVRHELTTTERFKLSLNNSEQISHYPQRILLREMQSLRDLAENFPSESFKHAVDEIVRAEKIYVVGMRGSAALAQYFTYFLRKVKRPVYALTHGGTQEYDFILEMNARDVTVVLAFPRYPRETLEMARVIQRRGGPIVGITDSSGSPLCFHANTVLVVPISFTTLFDSYSAPLCLLNMLVTEVGRVNLESSKGLLDEFESLARDIRVFHKERETQRHIHKEDV
jgi:DNA-binding MurR/RpiR family transcriptional regulator